jgi:hypothetical protein
MLAIEGQAKIADQTGMGAMGGYSGTLRTFPNLVQPVHAASEQRWIRKKKNRGGCP